MCCICSKICFNRTIEIQLLLIAICVVHNAVMGNFFYDVYDPKARALYLYLVYMFVFLFSYIVLYPFYRFFYFLSSPKTY